MTERELLARPDDLALLRAVAAGRVVRGEQGGETSVFSAHYFDGMLVRLELRRLAAQELINMPISGVPTLAPRGWRLLSTANGEQAADIDQP
jgi:hypothetical protein